MVMYFVNIRGSSKGQIGILYFIQLFLKVFKIFKDKSNGSVQHLYTINKKLSHKLQINGQISCVYGSANSVITIMPFLPKL